MALEIRVGMSRLSFFYPIYKHLLSSGTLVKRVSYSPLGLVLEDTQEDLTTYVGWHGGLDLQEGGVFIIRQAYPWTTFV